MKIINKFIFLSFIIIKSVISDCSREEPISVSGVCKLEYCTQAQYDSKYCIINNTYAKTKWINNLIFIGDLYFRYINFATYSEGHLVVETTCYPPKAKRMFFGLKSNGRPFFTNKTNNEETLYYSINLDNDNQKSLESKGIIIQSSDNSNRGEFFLSLSKLECNAELFDFNKDEVYAKTISDFSNTNGVCSLRHTFFSYYNSDSQYYYIFGFNSYGDKLHLQKHIFNSISGFQAASSYTNEETIIEDIFGQEVSCFQTVEKLIICFILKKSEGKYYYYFIKYNHYFGDINDYMKIESTIIDKATFYKCIHLKDEVGVFAYYKNNTGKFNPVILFRKFASNQFQYFLSLWAGHYYRIRGFFVLQR